MNLTLFSFFKDFQSIKIAEQNSKTVGTVLRCAQHRLSSQYQLHTNNSQTNFEYTLIKVKKHSK